MKILIWLLLASNLCMAQVKLSIDEAVKLALSNNFDIKNNQFTYNQAEMDLKYSKQSLWPTVSSNFSQGANAGRSIDPFSNAFVQNGISSNSYGISIDQNIYNGFKAKNIITRNEINLKKINYENVNAKRQLKIAVIQAYLQILLHEQLYKQSQEQETLIIKQLEMIQAKIAEGIAFKAQKIDIDAQLAKAEFDKINALGNIDIAKLELQQLIGKPLNFNTLPLELEKKPFKNAVFDELIVGINRQPKIMVRDYQLKASKINEEIAASLKKPSIRFSGGIGSAFSSAASREFTYFRQLNFNLNQYARVEVSFPIYSAGQFASQINTAKLNTYIAQNQLNAEIQNFKTEIEKIYFGVKQAYAKMQSASKNVSSNKTSLESATLRFEEGITNNIELAMIRLNYFNASSLLLQSEYEYHFKQLILLTYLEF